MEKKECEECGKVIEGYTSKHASFLMSQHKLKHLCDREDSLLKLEKKKRKS